jgi:hypothetical protein
MRPRLSGFPVQCPRGEFDSEATCKEDLFRTTRMACTIPPTASLVNPLACPYVTKTSQKRRRRGHGSCSENAIRVSGTSLGRLICGALIIHRTSSLMGSLLFRLSEHSVSLHKFLAVRPPFRAARVDYYRDGPSWCAWSARGVPGGRRCARWGC